MKKMKKILSVILTLAMVLGMSVTTFATGGGGEPTPPTTDNRRPATGTKDDKSQITIHGFELVEKAATTPGENPTKEIPDGLTITAYQIVKAKYESNLTYEKPSGQDEFVSKEDGTFSGYEAIYKASLTGFTGPVIDTDTPAPSEDPNNKELAIQINEDHLTAIWNYITEKGKVTDSYSTSDITVKNVTVDDEDVSVERASDGETFSVTLKNLPVGSYLIAVTGSESKIYNPIVASIYYDVNKATGGNVYDDGSLNLNDYKIKTTDNWVKVTDEPKVEKSIVTRNESDVITSTNPGGSANIGDHIEYQVVINPIPEYKGESPLLNIVDTLSESLQYDDNVTVKIYDEVADMNTAKIPATLDTDQYSVTKPSESDNKKDLTVDFVLTSPTDGGNGYTLNNYVGKVAVISYTATLLDSAKMNQTANDNDVKLSYTRNSRETGSDGKPIKEEDTSKTYSYTFDIDGGVLSGTDVSNITQGILEKTGEQWDEKTSEYVLKPLDEAEFTLYTKNPDKLASGEEPEDFIYQHIIGDGADKVKFDGKVTSDGGGKLPIRGLAAGTTDNPAKYYLKETKAPDGYSLNAHVFEIQIAATYYSDDVKVTNGDIAHHKGELQSWTITIDGNDATTGSAVNSFEVTHKGQSVENIVKVNGNSPDANGNYAQNSTHKVTIKNTKIASLPSTGGIGTTIFTFGGCAIMILAAALFFISRRKSAK